jgi:hypothetical protein
MDEVFRHAHCACILANAVVYVDKHSSKKPTDLNYLARGAFGGRWESLVRICQEQLLSDNKYNVILKMFHFPLDVPIFDTRSTASNGYVQIKNIAALDLFGAQPYVHRVAAMFRQWEQHPTWTLDQMAEFVAGAEATQLMLTPLAYVFKRNINPQLISFESPVYSRSRSFCW